MLHWNLDLHWERSPVLRYGFSVVCVAVALGLALAVQHYQFHDVAPPLFDLSIGLVTWYSGIGPSALAVLLSAVCFDYFFAPPIYSLSVDSSNLPYFLVFITWALLVAGFATVRRRVEEDLRQARDRLQADVEERKRREEEVRKLNQKLADGAAELQATNKELESFAYSVSHDLRAPLRHVVGYSELLQKRVSPLLDDTAQRYVQTILESAKRMGNLIDDLLSFSRIGRAETKKTSVSLQQLVDEIVAEIGRDTESREIVWRIGNLPVCSGDRSMLRLAIANLLSNAVKFTRGRTPAEIEIGCAKKEQDEVEVFVKDNGAGFDMRYVDKLFGVFQRLHRPDEFEGTGIGLATVQRIIHRHGGKVRAEGAEDRGATFYFSIPGASDTTERSARTP